MKAICNDLSDEYQALDAIVSKLDTNGWQTITPFFGWTVKDEISHIAYFDKAAKLSATNADAFQDHYTTLIEGFTSYGELHNQINGIGGAMSDHDLLEWWRTERSELLEAYAKLDPKTRLPWYGPTMSARSSATARLMETWAHGQDIADALGIERELTDRLKHIAHIGVSTCSWSFVNLQLEAPESDIHVELESPSGKTWRWGSGDASESISGPAVDFCLVVTQRRHYLDTSLKIHGDSAQKWMEHAQAFAGPPEKGPVPGERVPVHR